MKAWLDGLPPAVRGSSRARPRWLPGRLHGHSPQTLGDRRDRGAGGRGRGGPEHPQRGARHADEGRWTRSARRAATRSSSSAGRSRPPTCRKFGELGGRRRLPDGHQASRGCRAGRGVSPRVIDGLLLQGPRPVRSVVLARLISAVERGGEGATRSSGRASRARATRGRRDHRRPGRGQVDAHRRLVAAAARATASRSACSRSIRRARSAAARSSATGSACTTTRPTTACSSARWRRAATSAASRSRRRGGRACSTRSASDVVVIETVGVGQVEVEIAGSRRHDGRRRDPGWATRSRRRRRACSRSPTSSSSTRPTAPARARRAATCADAPHLGRGAKWTPPILETVATEGTGIGEMVDAVWRHRGWLEREGLAGDRARRLWQEVETLVALRAADLAKRRASASRSWASFRRRLGARA